MPEAIPRRRARKNARQTRMPSPRAKKQAATNAAEQLHAHYSECRALGHDWQHIGAPDNSDGGPALGQYAYASRCRHCGTERTKWFNGRGLSAGSRYRYPDEYQSRGEGKLDRSDWGTLFIRTHLGPL